MSETNPKPKILFLMGQLVDGGAERVFVNYVRHAKMVEPIVVLRNSQGRMYPQLPENCRVELIGRDDRPGSAAGSRRSFREWLRDTYIGGYLAIAHQALRTLAYSWRIAGIARRTGATVMTCFLMESHLVGLLGKRLFRKDLKVLVNVHEHISGSVQYTYPTGLERWALKFVMRYLYPYADQIIVVAESMKEDLVEQWGQDPDKISVAYNPIDLAEISAIGRDPNLTPARTSNREETVLVFLGRLVYLKGVHHLVEAVKHLDGRLPVRALLLGEGEEDEDLKAQCRELGVLDQVEFLGWLDNPWQVVASADLLVLPSLTEAFPQAIVEAMALGIPVVASDCSPGVRETLDNGKYGRLVPPGNSEALADAIEELMANPGERANYTDLGRERIKMFSLQNTVPSYERILLEIQRA